jgi:glucose-1-phosphate cytidylyltransferase
MTMSEARSPTQCVILAGGLGSRMSEITGATPKPLVMANGEPLIRHVIRIFENQGVRRFLVLAGYLSHQLHSYFSSLLLPGQAVTYTRGASLFVSEAYSLDQQSIEVTVVETGLTTQTAGRLMLSQGYLDERFFLAYSDSFANVDISELAKLHIAAKNLVTLTAVRPPSRFGHPILRDSKIISFTEKSTKDGDVISGGFMVVEKEALDLIVSQQTSFEIDVLPSLSESGRVGAYLHEGSFFAVDSLRDLRAYEEYLANES